jgi:hypothetical protein
MSGQVQLLLARSSHISYRSIYYFPLLVDGLVNQAYLMFQRFIAVGVYYQDIYRYANMIVKKRPVQLAVISRPFLSPRFTINKSISLRGVLSPLAYEPKRITHSGEASATISESISSKKGISLTMSSSIYKNTRTRQPNPTLPLRPIPNIINLRSD